MVQQVEVKPKKVGYFKKQHKNFKKNKGILLFLIPAILLTFLFGYIPMVGVLFAFKEKITPINWLYDFLTQPYTFRHVIAVFKDNEVITAIKNTLIISVSKIIIFFPLTIALAILLSEIKKQSISKLLLIILCLPNFLSWPVTIVIWNNLLSLDNGLINNIIYKLGGTPIYFFQDHFKLLVVLLSIWKGIGWGSIYFYAAIMSIDKEYYEAATIDGATKLQKIRYLTIPGILPVIALQFVMNITYILDAGFDQVYSMLQLVRSFTYEEQIIGTYIFNKTLENSNIPFTVAMSVVQGVFALFLMLFGNYLVKKKLGRSLW